MPPVVWITGLPGSGKSTIAEALRKRHPEFVILRMDELRKVATPEPTYSDEERNILYRALVFMALKLHRLGHPVIIDATANRRAWRDLARKLIPEFIEVYLRCPVEVCRRREEDRKKLHGAPREIYKKGNRGWPVPGVKVPYEEPLHPEVIVDTQKTSVEDAVRMIEQLLG